MRQGIPLWPHRQNQPHIRCPQAQGRRCRPDLHCCYTCSTGTASGYRGGRGPRTHLPGNTSLQRHMPFHLLQALLHRPPPPGRSVAHGTPGQGTRVLCRDLRCKGQHGTAQPTRSGPHSLPPPQAQSQPHPRAEAWHSERLREHRGLHRGLAGNCKPLSLRHMPTQGKGHWGSVSLDRCTDPSPAPTKCYCTQGSACLLHGVHHRGYAWKCQ